MAPGLLIRPYDPATDLAWAVDLLEAEFAGRMQARRGELVDALEGFGLVADMDGQRVGLLTWLEGPPPAGTELRAVVVEAGARGQGIGDALLDGAVRTLAAAGTRRVWLVTTNDALDALRFYQRRGFRLSALRPGAVDEARRTLKPAIGMTGQDAIPIRDELELELDLEPGPELEVEPAVEPAAQPKPGPPAGNAAEAERPDEAAHDGRAPSVPGHLG